MKFQPIGDFVAIKIKQAPERTKSGLYIPESEKSNVVEGTVMSVGKGKPQLLTGSDLPKSTGVQVRVGDNVWFLKFNATVIEVDGEELYVVSEQHILGYTR